LIGIHRAIGVYLVDKIRGLENYTILNNNSYYRDILIKSYFMRTV